MNWKLVFTKQTQKDAMKLKQAGLKDRALDILKILRENPFQSTLPFEKLVGDLSSAYSRRINIRHRVVYQIIADDKIVKIIRMWAYYE